MAEDNVEQRGYVRSDRDQEYINTRPWVMTNWSAQAIVQEYKLQSGVYRRVYSAHDLDKLLIRTARHLRQRGVTHMVVRL